MKTVAVIGGGPAGLMAAESIACDGIRVDVYEAKPSVGRKFLVAGKGGLNLTHSEPFQTFCMRYGPQPEQLRPILDAFTPTDVCNWSKQLGIETFVGFSKRVFPKDMKAQPLLSRWLDRLRAQGVRFHTQHRWTGWDAEDALQFESPNGPVLTKPDACVLALGGASWPKLGSDGRWLSLLQERGIEVAALKASNCGFETKWSEHFRGQHAGSPLKSVRLMFTNSAGESFNRLGSCVVTEHGLEGSLVYAASAMIRDEIQQFGSATVTLDLSPDRTVNALTERLSVPRGKKSMASHLRSKARIKGVEAGLLREVAAASLAHPARTAEAIKCLPISFTGIRPLEEAISTAGGVRFEQLDENLMVRSVPGLFCTGEMLDWEAPTGGYLLTACFATGLVAGRAAKNWVS
jgi:uncharacterized flavoprotein (TIGR03862 family)